MTSRERGRTEQTRALRLWSTGVGALFVLVGVAAALGAQTFTPPQGRVENVTWSRVGTTFTVTYDLAAEDPGAVFEVLLEVLMNGVPFKPVAVLGDIGDRVMPGAGKRISWESAKDTDNQDFDRFKFTVRAVYGRPRTDDAPAPGPAVPPAPVPVPVVEEPPRPPARHPTGVWRGTYAGFPALLSIQRSEPPAFSGTLVIVAKPGGPATEVLVEGLATQDAIELHEMSVQQRGGVNWQLGRGSGHLVDEGRKMAGVGDDRRNSYRWELTRTEDGPTLLGLWEGEYAGAPTRLMITRVDGSSFNGRLVITLKKGGEGTELEVEGATEGLGIQFRELAVVQPGAAGDRWVLGTAAGTIESQGLQLIGTGSDGKRSYRWFFVRQ